MILKIHWESLKKVEKLVTDKSWDEIKTELHSKFEKDPDVARYEELKFSNGVESVSLKDRCNKIIIQYKKT